MRIGILSDTHNLLRPEVPQKLTGCDLIIHAGDVNTHDLFMDLERIAPVVGARGNCDRGVLAELLAERTEFSFGPYAGIVIHDLKTLPPDFPVSNYRLIVYGHSHQPALHETGGTLFLNPGSAGPRRFSLPVSMAFLELDGKELKPELITLG